MMMTMAGHIWMMLMSCFVLLLLIASSGHQVNSGSNQRNTGFKSNESDFPQFQDSFPRPRKMRNVSEVSSAKVVTYSPGRPYVDAMDSGPLRSSSDPIIISQEVNRSSAGIRVRGIQDPTVFPVTFRSADAYLCINWKIYSTFSIYFQLRTYQSDGLVLFTSSGVIDNDFLAVELVSGQIRYVFDTGGGTRAIQSTLSSALNDGDWHLIGIVRSDLSRQTLVVDDWSAYDRTPPDVKSVHFDLNDDVYVGGIPVSVFPALPRQLRSTSGFHGCMASVVVNGKTRNLMEELVLQPPDGQSYVVAGCEGPSTDCQRHVCENEGRCEQQWSSYKCDCDLTTFTGTACNDESVAYSFGHAGGLVTFTFAAGEWPDTRTDQVALGLMTTQGNTVIFRMTSGSSSDFMEMEIVDGNIFVVYNMGLTDHVVGDQFEKVNDGRYHVVRFMRDGANATIQVDNLPVQFRNATGNQLTTFNHQMRIMIGGRMDLNNHLTRIFQGIISGLVVNGIRVLDLAAETDPRIAIDGDVELEVRSLRSLSRDPDHSYHRSRRPGSAFPSYKSKQNRTRGGGRHRHMHPSVADASRRREKSFLANSSWTRMNVSRSSAQAPSFISADGSGRGVRCAAEEDDEDGNCSWTSSGESSDDSSSSHPQSIEENSGGSEKFPLLLDRPLDLVSSSGGGQRTFAHALNFTEMPSRHSTTLDRALVRGVEALPVVTGVSRFREGSSVDSRGATTDSSDVEGSGLGRMLSRDLVIIVGVSSGLLLTLLILSLGVYRYRSRDQGSYKVDNRDYTLYEACEGAEENGAMYRLKNLKLNGKAQRKTVKEWYV